MLSRAEGGLRSLQKQLAFVLVPGECWGFFLSTVSGFPDLAVLWAQVQARDTECRGFHLAHCTSQAGGCHCESHIRWGPCESGTSIQRAPWPSSFVALASVKVVREGRVCVCVVNGNPG